MFAAGEDPRFPDDAVEVGRVVGAWGVKGGLRIKAFSADPQALFSSKRWYLQEPHAAQTTPRPHPGTKGTDRQAAASPAWPRLLRVVQAREQGEYIVATVQDLADRDAAQALAGARVFVSRGSFPTPQADEFYWVDLIGLAVRTREGTSLGTVVGLLETGPTCVLRVRPDDDVGAREATEAEGGTGGVPVEERLIPFVSAYVDRVDLLGRCLHVDWQPDY